jgi:hypothetical protein
MGRLWQLRAKCGDLSTAAAKNAAFGRDDDVCVVESFVVEFSKDK